MLLQPLFTFFLINLTAGEVIVRLSGGKSFNQGVLQILTKDGWGAVCDNDKETWSNIQGGIVCQHLGFPGLASSNFGDSDITNIQDNIKVATKSFDCKAGSSIEECKIEFSSACFKQDVISLRCKIESKSACQQNEDPALGSCYSVQNDVKSFAEASNNCRRNGGDLVEIQNSRENIVLGMILSAHKGGSPLLWTGGVVSQIVQASSNMWWHPSQSRMEYLNGLDTRGAGQIPMGVAFNWQKDLDNKVPVWKIKDLETQLPYICETKQSEVGCLSADDPEGLKYEGPAERDSAGIKCIPWNIAGLEPDNPAAKWTHNQCRNPDEDIAPYCYIDDSGEPSTCSIPRCGQEAKKSPTTVESTCKSKQTESVCEAEEFACKDNTCIYKGYVCDGEKDCRQGEDELNCRRFSSLYSKEEGFQLKGDENDVLKASEEECARECFYRKAESGTCTSFSHRPGKDGKADKCILGSITKDMDCVVERANWNYYTLNSTEKVKRGVTKLTVLQGMRFRRIKSNRKEILEVKVDGDWGGVCDDGFTMKEANVVCNQLGFNLGAQKVIPRAGRGTDTKIVVQGVKCQGNEESLTGCEVDTKVKSCSSDQAVGVICREVEKVCEDDQFHCHSGECIRIDQLCDGVSGNKECSDGSDELPLYCESLTQVRLRGEGDNIGSGLLEVRHKGVWGTVCNDNFNQEEADVFCRMLGREGKASWRDISTYKQKPGSWPIWIQFPQEEVCTGNESTIEMCHNKDLWIHDYTCSHHEDVELICTEDADIVSVDAQPRILQRLIRNTGRQIVENCGLRKKPSNNLKGFDIPRVAGGESVQVGAIPWQASVRLRGPDNLTFHHCGAVIISPFHVLTTAHCLWDYRKKLEIYYVRVGDNVIEVEDVGEANYDIEKVDFHEGFNIGPYLNNDIAIIHLKKKRGGIRFGNNVGAVCLPSTELQYPGLNVRISGWGKNSYDVDLQGRNYVSKLQAATVPVIATDECQRDDIYGKEKLSSGMFCAGILEGGVDSCQGDSGGPAVVFTTLGQGLLAGDTGRQGAGIGGEEKGVLAGITSWGYGCGRMNKPGVYTRVSKYVPWILDKIREANN